MIEEIMDDINERKNGIMLNEVKKKTQKLFLEKKCGYIILLFIHIMWQV